MGRINVAYAIFEGPLGPNKSGWDSAFKEGREEKALHQLNLLCAHCCFTSHNFRLPAQDFSARNFAGILAEGAIALSVTLSGGALFAS